jgi:hypothetical protein
MKITRRCGEREERGLPMILETNPPAEAPTYSGDDARRFLDFLGNEQFEFRCFPDPKPLKGRSGFGMKRYVGRFDQHEAILISLNRQGYGINVQIGVSDGKGFGAKNIVGSRALFADFDHTPLANLDRFPLRPDIIVETSPGRHHAYWRVSDIPVTLLKRTQQRIATLLGTDDKVVDLARVMRLPGFLHQKNPEAPHLVRILDKGGR